MQANAASKRLLSLKYPDIQIVLEGHSFSIPDKDAKQGTAAFEIDGLLFGSKVAVLVESKTGLAAKHVSNIERTAGFVKKHCYNLGLSKTHADLLAHTEIILVLARPAVSSDLLAAIAVRNPKVCVIADCGGAFEVVRDGVGFLHSGPADPAAAKGGVLFQSSTGAAIEPSGASAAAAVRAWSYHGNSNPSVGAKVRHAHDPMLRLTQSTAHSTPIECLEAAGIDSCDKRAPR